LGTNLLFFQRVFTDIDTSGWVSCIDYSGDGEKNSNRSARITDFSLEDQLLRKAELVSESGDFKWRLGDRPLVFGGMDGVPVNSLIGRGYSALIEWSGTSHVLTKISNEETLDVNNEPVFEKSLIIGDRIKVGMTLFSYRIQGGLTLLDPSGS